MGYFIGIDIGLDGAMARIDPTGAVTIIDTPTAVHTVNKRDRRVYHPAEMWMQVGLGLRALAILGDTMHVVLERVQAMPGGGERSMGATSAFAFGRGFGLWEGIVAATRAPYTLVPPQTWKRHFNLLGQPKDASRDLAQRLFPGAAAYLTRKKDHGRAEALLLAEYGRRTHG